ncbi:MurR/RpiR family transcriptional regulator [Aerococcaceae bacterium NML191292]|nr:MurR/RpiR family transcriptional regulator [Aerococcaceae bacterium NML191292]
MFTHEQLQSLNELEFEVYKYVCANMESIPKMKIRDLADKAHVSTSTVLRFCQKVGCDGYSELKLNIKRELTKSTLPCSEKHLVMMKEYFSSISSEQFHQQLGAVARVLAKAEQVVFCGIGSSGILAKYGARWLMVYGKSSYHIDDSWLTIPKGLCPNIAVVLLSVSGEITEIIRLAEEYSKQGATTIALTSSAISTLARMSNHVLSYSVPVEYLPNGTTNVTTHAPCLFILEQLARMTPQYFD